MTELKKVPSGLDDIIAVYGNPDANDDFEVDPRWAADNLRRYVLPFPLRLSWNTESIVKGITAHRKVGKAMIDALDEIAQHKGAEYLEKHRLDYFGGVFNVRRKRGGDQLSVHSWAIAIDLNPHIAPLGEDPGEQPRFIVNAFKDRGFIWGGDFRRPDGMHFQACRGY